MVFVSAFSAASRHFSAGHGDERSVDSLNDLQVSNDERMVNCNGAEGPKAIFQLFHQFDANLSDFHGVDCTPFCPEFFNSRFVSNSRDLLFDP